MRKRILYEVRNVGAGHGPDITFAYGLGTFALGLHGQTPHKWTKSNYFLFRWYSAGIYEKMREIAKRNEKKANP